MTTKNVSHIKSVTATKEGRFWALKADGKLLGIVLYKTGAFELKRLIQTLAGLPVDEPDDEKLEAKAVKGKPSKPAAKAKPTSKPKPPQKTTTAKAAQASTPEPATANP